ncbi:hypothetical protein [Kineococcus radiotolerans]|uniref:Uncharacterized protein n=1 Tax=Kineococcus radiotolerans (strain ATCC BAA-149 / DSM 14245 / SRS30216) TaxID=266940 RepID=A6WAB8_KINRD|nr:hypothetical protein [Kineococcus radiotolerans]ABS03757.1 hypothetical protein Krad_2276 [Kineococcus radiotolerans SRS30216 = ATCC BAA-149]
MNQDDSFQLRDLLEQAGGAGLSQGEAETVFAQAWARIEEGIAREPGDTAEKSASARRLDVLALQPQRRRRRARAIVITSAVLLAGASSAAAAEYIAARTGQHLNGWELGAAGPGEVLDQGGSDYRQVLEDSVAGIPFAPGYEAQRADTLTQGMLQAEAGSQLTEGAARAQFARNALCTWADAWVVAQAAGNTTAQAQAVATLAAAHDWPDVQALDEYGPATSFAWLAPLESAARAGDRQGVLDAVTDSSRCRPDLAPAIAADPAFQGFSR